MRVIPSMISTVIMEASIQGIRPLPRYARRRHTKVATTPEIRFPVDKKIAGKAIAERTV